MWLTPPRSVAHLSPPTTHHPPPHIGNKVINFLKITILLTTYVASLIMKSRGVRKTLIKLAGRKIWKMERADFGNRGNTSKHDHTYTWEQLELEVGLEVFGAHSTKSDAHNVLSQLHCIYRSRQDWSLGTNSSNSFVFWSPLEMRKACCIVTLNIHSPNSMIVCPPLFNSRLFAYHCGAWILPLEFFMMIFRVYVWILVGIS